MLGMMDLGVAYIDTIEQMAKVKRCVVDVVLPGGTSVLNADDELVAAMAEHSKGEVLYFTRTPEIPLITEHLQKGGRAVIVRG
jgi:cyanophycin synthetase